MLCLLHLAPLGTLRSCSSSSGIFLVSINSILVLNNKYLNLLVKWPILHILQLLLLEYLILTTLSLRYLGCLLIRRLSVFDLLLGGSQVFIDLLVSCSGANSTRWWLSIQGNNNIFIGLVRVPWLRIHQLVQGNSRIFNALVLGSCGVPVVRLVDDLSLILVVVAVRYQILQVLAHWWKAFNFLN